MQPAAVLGALLAAQSPVAALKIPYTPCGEPCVSDGFAAGGVPGDWVGTICPAKCAECQDDGVIPPASHKSSAGIPHHKCESSPDQLYTRPTTDPSPNFAVTVNGAPVEAVIMRDYRGHMQTAQFVLRGGSAAVEVAVTGVEDPSAHALKPRRRQIATSFSDGTIRFTVTEPQYLVLQFDSSPHALMLFIEQKPSPTPTGAGVATLASFGVRPTDGDAAEWRADQTRGDAIQKAIDTVLASETVHTLVFPAEGALRTYITHDLHISNHTSGVPKQLFFEVRRTTCYRFSSLGCVCRRRCVLSQEGVLLQRSGAHIGPFTSPGFFTIFNSRGVSLRGLATFDALNGGQGMCTQTPPKTSIGLGYTDALFPLHLPSFLFPLHCSFFAAQTSASRTAWLWTASPCGTRGGGTPRSSTARTSPSRTTRSRT